MSSLMWIVCRVKFKHLSNCTFGRHTAGWESSAPLEAEVGDVLTVMLLSPTGWGGAVGEQGEELAQAEVPAEEEAAAQLGWSKVEGSGGGRVGQGHSWRGEGGPGWEMACKGAE